jgi:hypothetical protein
VKQIASVLFVAMVATLGYGQTEVKSFSLATGEVLVFPFEGGVPKPSESRWSVCRGAGPAFVPEGNAYRLSWIVDLQARGSAAALHDISHILLQEVSGKKAETLFEGKPEITADGLLVNAPARLVTRLQYPWLYTNDRTIFVFRVQLERPGAKPDILLQPVLVGPEVKRQLKDKGYLP